MTRPVHENLDTAYVNLAALLRYLQSRKFAGRVHVELDEYDADVFLSGKDAPRVRETDHATGRSGEGEAALQRLLVRAREAGGLVSVYEESGEDLMGVAQQADSIRQSNVLASSNANANYGETRSRDAAQANLQNVAGEASNETDAAWNELVSVSGELIAAVERATASYGADFMAHFRATRLALADDYAFLDPSAGRFEYTSGGAAHWRARQLDAKVYVAGLSECLRRVVDRIAAQVRADQVKGLRERIALELAVLARRRQSALARAQFTPQLDRVAGTRVL